ncbi:MAG: SH3 domain-containing protein [Clostridiaceae bacterium]|nr:SH3 domain-containing protein [Clostridiaceae bacterium]
MKFIGLPKEYRSPGEGIRTVIGIGLLLALAFVSILGADAMFSNSKNDRSETSYESSTVSPDSSGSEPSDPVSTDPISASATETDSDLSDPSASEPDDTTAATDPSFTETEESAVYYATGEINVRSGPGTDYEIIETLEWGNKINVVASTDNGWKKIGNNRYVISEFITKKIPEKPFSGKYYAKGELNVRSGPGTDYEIVRELSKGSAIEVVAITANDWYRTVKDTYVLASLCSDDRPATPTPTRIPTKIPTPAPTKIPVPSGVPEMAAAVGLSVDDFELMAGIVESERPSGTGMKTGQIWVAQVIWNRVNNKSWPNTVFQVITQKDQFSTDVYNSETGEYTSKLLPQQSSREAVVEAFQNPPIPTNVIFFNQAGCPDTERWKKIWVYYGDCGGNSFFLNIRV